MGDALVLDPLWQRTPTWRGERINLPLTAQRILATLHPGGKTEDTELEEEYGRYIYQVEIRDAQGVQWDVELDATNAQVLKNQRDD